MEEFLKEAELCKRIKDSGPSGVGLRRQALNHRVLRWLKTVVVSDREKAHLMRQAGSSAEAWAR